MADVVSKAVRSRMMGGIRGKNTNPEIIVRRWLHANGYRFRLHARDLAGSPDIVLPKWGALVFVHGCFWHRHDGCRYATTPASRRDFWEAKLEANKVRDQRNGYLLVEQGWRVAAVWECSLKGNRMEQTMIELSNWLRSSSASFETPLTTVSS